MRVASAIGNNKNDDYWITDETGIRKKLVAVMLKVAEDTPEANLSDTIKRDATGFHGEAMGPRRRPRCNSGRHPGQSYPGC